LTRWMV